MNKTKILLASPMGFCAGVERAVEIVDLVVTHFTCPVFVKHEIVHNNFIIDQFVRKGVKFIEDIDEVSQGAVLIYSAHGVSQDIKRQAKAKDIRIFDATCPLVSKIHMEVLRASLQGKDCILVGHANHPEVEGVIGHFDSSFGGSVYLVETEEDADQLVVNQPGNLFCVTQTTLSVDETSLIHRKLCARFPDIVYPKKDDICYATQNRQDALRKLAKVCDLLFVIGSSNSSNTNRLLELAQAYTESYMIDSHDDIQNKWLKNKKIIGITAGASAPSNLIDSIVSYLEKKLDCHSELMENDKEEDIVFSLPRELRLLSVS